MQLPRLAIVDLETTGADAARDRITEIAILITEGNRLIEQWSSLVNPGVPIPPRIEAINGINDALVASAPSFAELAGEVARRLAGAVFVAHNARFDYNFLREAFERLGQPFSAEVLCSVKFSRAIAPEHARHGLDAIIARQGYVIDARHRALDDALIVWRYLQDCRAHYPAEAVQRAWQRGFSQNSVPRLPTGALEALPDAPGVYALFGAAGQVLEISQARNLRSQVLGMFTGTPGDAKRRRLAALVRDVDARPAAGALHAALLELQLRRQLGKATADGAFGWHWQRAAEAPPVLTLRELTGTDPAHWQDVLGCFRGPKEADTALRQLATRHRLCPQRIGLEFGQGACSAHGLKRCKGVCCGQESVAQHDQRLAALAQELGFSRWCSASPLLIHEAHGELAVTHVFDHWCYLGSAGLAADLAAVTEAPRRFDAEIWRLLKRYLDKTAAQTAIDASPETA